MGSTAEEGCEWWRLLGVDLAEIVSVSDMILHLYEIPKVSWNIGVFCIVGCSIACLSILSDVVVLYMLQCVCCCSILYNAGWVWYRVFYVS